MTKYRTGEEKRERTHAKLIHTLCLLAAENPGKNITVTELTERAQVSRGTFYLHFTDIPDMYDTICAQACRQMESCFDDYLEQYTEELYLDALTRIIDLADRNKSMFRLLLSSQIHRTKISDTLGGLYRVFWQRYGKQEIPDVTWDFLLSYHTSGIMTCIEKWVDGTLPLSKEELLRHLTYVDEGFDEITERLC